MFLLISINIMFGLIDNAGVHSLMKMPSWFLFRRNIEAQTGNGIAWTKMNSTIIAEWRRN